MKGGSKIGYALVILAILAIFVFAGGLNWVQTGELPGGLGPSAPSNCPDTGKTNVTFNIQNILDTTTNDVYDETIVCSSQDSSHVKSITATTDDGTDLNCGETYVCRGTSSDGIKGDHANFQSILSGDATVSDGVVTFTTDGPQMRIDIGSTLHGIPQMRVYDNSAAAFCYGRQSGKEGGAAGAWQNESIYFQSTTNATALAVGSGGNLDLCMDFKIYAHTDECFMDYWWYFMIDAATTVWDTPTVTVDGVTLSDYAGQVNTDEAKAYSGEEYIYKITDWGSKITNNDYARVCMNINALAGVDPTTDINISLASGGAYTKTSEPTVVARGAVKDDSSQTQVFDLEEWTLDIS